MGAVVRSLSCSLSFATGPEGVSKLGDSEDAFPAVALDLFRRDSPKQTEIILLHRLVVAALAEFTNLAVVVEDQLGLCLSTAQFFHVYEGLLGLSWIRVELYPRRLTVPAVPDDSTARCHPLISGERPAVE